MVVQGVQIGIIDLAALAVILFFFILGIFKGFTFQLVRLVTIVVALAVAKQYAGSTEGVEPGGLAAVLVRWFPNQLGGNHGIAVYIAFFIIFTGIFVLGTLIAFLLRSLLKRLALRSYDRLLGGLFGAVSGAAVVVVILSCVVFISPDSPFMDRLSSSHAFRYSGKVIRLANPFFPPEIQGEIGKLLQRFPQTEEETREEEH